MSKLPVFEKGIVDSKVDPASFWSKDTGKNFFTGNTTALDSIGHIEEPREVDEDEFINENMKACNQVTDENQQFYHDNDGDNNDYDYYGENGEYYGDNMEDYDYDPNDDFGYDEDDEDETEDDDEEDDEEDNLYAVGSRPSSGRRASNDDLTVPPSEVESGKQVEER